MPHLLLEVCIAVLRLFKKKNKLNFKMYGSIEVSSDILSKTINS